MTSVWDQAYSQLQLFHAKQDCLPQKDEGPLGRWCSAQRLRMKRGQLGPHQQAKLERIPGWVWSLPQPTNVSTTWSSNNQYGAMPRRNEGELGEWCRQQRDKYQRHSFSNRRSEKLQKTHDLWWEQYPSQSVAHLLGGVVLIIATVYFLWRLQ